MSVKIGIIAEDQSDVAVTAELISKLIPRNRFSIRSFVGHGCGKIRAKCREWANQLRSRGCQALILVHDLDLCSLTKLRKALDTAITPCPITPHVIVIPIQEIEAWLLCDPHALRRVFSLKKAPSLPRHP